MSAVLGLIRCALRLHVPGLGVDPARSALWCCGRCGQVMPGAMRMKTWRTNRVAS
jgi:hypothetical protein